MRKLSALTNLFNNYNPALDLFSMAAVAALFAIGLLSKSIRLHAAALPPILILSIAFLAMPQILFTSDGADTRLTLPIALLLIASVRTTEWSRGLVISGGFLFCLFAIRMAVILSNWQCADKLYREVMESLAKVGRGSYLVSAELNKGRWQPFPWPVSHIACLAVIERDAFVPALFAFPAQQPIRFAGEYADLAGRFKSVVFENGKTPNWHGLAMNFDNLLVFDRDNIGGPDKEDWELLHRGNGFGLYGSRFSKYRKPDAMTAFVDYRFPEYRERFIAHQVSFRPNATDR